MLASACSGSAPTPAPTGSSTLAECAWGQSALDAPHRAIAVTKNDAIYELVDITSGRVLGSCPTGGSNGVASYLAAYQAPTFQGRAAADDTFNALWFGGFRPGGESGTVVVTSSGTVDLATGQRVAVRTAGYRSAAVARHGIVMVRADAGSANSPPSRAEDWCILPLSGNGQCAAIDGPSGAGTPLVTSDGDVAWLPTELTRTDIVVSVDDPSSNLYVRSGAGLVTATADLQNEIPNSFDESLVSASGRAFLVSPEPSSTADLAGSGQPRWYTVDNDNTLAAHRAAASYRDVADLLGADPRSLLIDDTNVVDDGRTLVLTVRRNASPVLVAVPEQGQPHILFDTAAPNGAAGERPGYLATDDHFLTPLDGAIS